jgi:hypothetical protein
VCGIHSPASRTVPSNRRHAQEDSNSITTMPDTEEVPRS